MAVYKWRQIVIILSPEDKNLYKEITLSKEETEVSKKIDKEVQEEVENSDAMKHLKNSYEEWKATQEQTMKLIASLIEQVLKSATTKLL